jgi:hypothetical protein
MDKPKHSLLTGSFSALQSQWTTRPTMLQGVNSPGPHQPYCFHTNLNTLNYYSFSWRVKLITFNQHSRPPALSISAQSSAPSGTTSTAAGLTSPSSSSSIWSPPQPATGECASATSAGTCRSTPWLRGASAIGLGALKWWRWSPFLACHVSGLT